MIISKTSEYAMRVLLYLVENCDQGLVSVNTLHKQLNIPYKYLGRLMSKLSREKFVVSVRGKYGGYRLSKTENPIYLIDIVNVIDGSKTWENCMFGYPSCDGDSPCPLHKYWENPRNEIMKMFNNVSIHDLEANKNLSILENIREEKGEHK